jgi:hypothetical protein
LRDGIYLLINYTGIVDICNATGRKTPVLLMIVWCPVWVDYFAVVSRHDDSEICKNDANGESPNIVESMFSYFRQLCFVPKSY